MGSRVFGADEKAKLERLVNEGVTVYQEVEDLTAGLKDTVKAVAEELDIKPSLNSSAHIAPALALLNPNFSAISL